MQQKVDLGPVLDQGQILVVFLKYGYNERSFINQDKLAELLNEEHQNKTNGPADLELIEEIWSDSDTSSKGEILVGTIADIILNTQQILKDRISKLRESEGQIQQLDGRIKQKQIQIKEYADLHTHDRATINDMKKELINMQIQQKTNQHQLHNFIKDYQTIANIFGIAAESSIKNPILVYNDLETRMALPQSKIEQKKPENTLENSLEKSNHIVNSSYVQSPYVSYKTSETNQQQNSKRLLWLFYLTVACLLAELLIMSSLRLWMIPLTVYLHSLFILTLGLYSQGAVLYLICHGGFSVIGDLAFIVLTFMAKYDMMPFHHTRNQIYLVFLFFLIIGTVAVRVIILSFYFALRNAYSSTPIQYFTFFGHKFIFAPNLRALTNSGFLSATLKVLGRENDNSLISPQIQQVEKFNNPFESKNLSHHEENNRPNLIEKEVKN